MKSRKWAYDLVKIENRRGSRVIQSMETDLEESECVYFLQILLKTPLLMIQRKLDCPEAEAKKKKKKKKKKESTNCNARNFCFQLR